MNLAHAFLEEGGLQVHAWVGPRGLVAVRLGEIPEGARADGGRPVAGIEIRSTTPALAGWKEAIRRYLRGEPFLWVGPRDERGLTEFQRDVFARVGKIPRGTTITYGDVARDLDRPQAVRAVGSALLRNPFPILVPCHRVVKDEGVLGGYTCGLACKRRLLALEAGQTDFDWTRS
jgi:O-6-methylguanine DNA methyltransferase